MGFFFSLEQIANAAGLSYSTVQRAFAPQRVERLTLIRIGVVLNVPLSGKDFIKKPPTVCQGMSSTKDHKNQLMSDDRPMLRKILGCLSNQLKTEKDPQRRKEIEESIKEIQDRLNEMDQD